MSKLGQRILYVWKQTSERRQNTWSPPFWQGQAIYAGPAAPDMIDWDWEQEEVGNTVRKAREGHLGKNFREARQRAERWKRTEKDIVVVEFKAWKRSLVQGWYNLGIVDFYFFFEEKRIKISAGKTSKRVCIHWEAVPLHNSGCNRILSLCCFSISKHHLISLSHWIL